MRLPSPLLRIGLLVLLAALAALPARAQESLSVAEVQQVIAQAVVEAQARNRSATIAVGISQGADGRLRFEVASSMPPASV